MATEIRVPTLGESVTEATIATWFKRPGDAVDVDEMLCELETDKVTVEVPSPVSGVLQEIVANEGDTVEVNALLANVEEGASGAKTDNGAKESAPKSTPQAAEEKPEPKAASAPQQATSAGGGRTDVEHAPSAKKLMAEHNLSADQISGTGRDGRIMKPDVLAALSNGAATRAEAPAQSRSQPAPDDESREKRVRMTRLRQSIARRLKDAQNTAAMLTTYNEVDMSAVMGLRSEYKDEFQKRHDVKLGFMGFFIKACVNALKELPAVNAEIDGQDLVYKNYYHIGVAVGTPQGLVVPVIRDADRMNFADIEKKIGDLGVRARDGKLSMAELQGGTFTISNGGVYGSLMSSPILNPPQSGILGMHKIQDRPVAIGGKVEVRPMMYLALSYDHRIIDGKEAVTFLVRVKEAIEDPRRLLMDL